MWDFVFKNFKKLIQMILLVFYYDYYYNMTPKGFMNDSV